MNKKTEHCPECESTELYVAKVPKVLTARQPLISVGSFLSYGPRVNMVVCTNCGLIRLYLEQDALKRVVGQKRWRKL
jgi:hypothetical protein